MQRLNLEGQLISQPDTSTSARCTSMRTGFWKMPQYERWVSKMHTSTSTGFSKCTPARALVFEKCTPARALGFRKCIPARALSFSKGELKMRPTFEDTWDLSENDCRCFRIIPYPEGEIQVCPLTWKGKFKENSDPNMSIRLTGEIQTGTLRKWGYTKAKIQVRTWFFKYKKWVRIEFEKFEFSWQWFVQHEHWI